MKIMFLSYLKRLFQLSIKLHGSDSSASAPRASAAYMTNREPEPQSAIEHTAGPPTRLVVSEVLRVELFYLVNLDRGVDTPGEQVSR